MHNVRLDQIEATAKAAADDPSAAKLEADLDGGWRVDEEARAPTPLAYRFYGAMCCYEATFATQAAMAGVHLKSLQISLSVDYRAALGRCRTQWHPRPRPESCRGGARLTSL